MNYPQIPKHIRGKSSDIVSMVCKEDEILAIEHFKEVKNHLISVNKWHTYSDDIRTDFYLVDENDNLVSKGFEIGNYIKINIPGPGNPSGKGFDWTEITSIQDGSDETNNPFFAFTVKPCAAPNVASNSTTHFYTDDTTNTFVARCVSNCVYLEVHSRNELENTKNVPILDKIRNKAIAVGGKLGLGNLNWDAFTKGLL
jgi:hypothetical protein